MSVVEQEQQVVAEPVVELDEVGKRLLEAAEYIRVHGHAKGDGLYGVEGWTRDTDHSLCVAHAIGTGHTKAHKRLIASLGFGSITEVFAWNDAPERTKEEAITALERAAYGI